MHIYLWWRKVGEGMFKKVLHWPLKNCLLVRRAEVEAELHRGAHGNLSGDAVLTFWKSRDLEIIGKTGKITVTAMAIGYNWLFPWDDTFYKWGFVSTYNWYFGPQL